MIPFCQKLFSFSLKVLCFFLSRKKRLYVLSVLARGSGWRIGGVGLSWIRIAAADGEPWAAVTAGPEPEVGMVADSVSIVGAVFGDAARRVHRRRRS